MGGSRQAKLESFSIETLRLRRAKPGELQVRVTTRANSKQEAAALSAPVLDGIQKQLGEAIYGVDAKNLQSVAVAALLERGLSVSVAEACTGGMLSELLNSIPDADKIFRYAVSAASNRVKEESLRVPAKMMKKFGS
jgi:nicotinamide-nucleotide amidase